ncbi:hypothetical protein LBMAG48_28760 [Phycisphaerae bacterium]|nr:hypothetical protein LBMAG48_28760 [Phycisphaerae bacterium]
MPEAIPPAEITATALKFLPAARAADESVQQKLDALWGAGRRFAVLSGPPGVGKTRAAEDYLLGIAHKLQLGFPLEACRLSSVFPDFQTRTYSSVEIETTLRQRGISLLWDLAVLHPQYAYEDLIRGMRLGTAAAGAPSLQIREGLLGFLSRCTEVLDSIRPPTDTPSSVIVLDEINRAALGQLFGEAIYAVDRRGVPVTTPYSVEGYGSHFCVPSSLLILGTMNSVDRAISGFDFALKRRFVVVPMQVQREALISRYGGNPRLRSIATKAFDQVSGFLKSASKTGAVASSELLIGHSYFLAPASTISDADILRWLAQSIQFQIVPTLLDYSEQGLLAYDAANLGGSPLAEFITGGRALAELTTEAVLAYLNSLEPPAPAAQ